MSFEVLVEWSSGNSVHFGESALGQDPEAWQVIGEAEFIHPKRQMRNTKPEIASGVLSSMRETTA